MRWLRVVLIAVVSTTLGCSGSKSSGKPDTSAASTSSGVEETTSSTAASSAPRTFYVATDGRDSNPGTAAAPWATPGYGSRQLQPGDTLVIRGGRYTLRRYDDDIIKPPRSGRADAWIVIRGEEGHRPVLAGRDNLLAAVELGGQSYVRLENLEITHDDRATGKDAWFREGISIVGGSSSHLVFRNLYVHHVDEGAVDAQDISDVQFLDSRFEYAGFGALGGPAGEHGGWTNVRIERSRLAYSGHDYRGRDPGSERPYDRPDGFGIEASDGPIDIVDTVSEHNYGDGLDSKAANTTIRRSIVANNSADGLKLWQGPGRVENTLVYGRGDGSRQETDWAPVVVSAEKPGARYELVNVTVDDSLGASYLVVVQYDHQDVPLTLVLRNSIFRGTAPSSPMFVAKRSTLIVDHDLFDFPATPELLVRSEEETGLTMGELGGLGAGLLAGDSRFVTPADGRDGDYHLAPGSPAIDAGTTDGAPADDLAGRARDGRPDLGAYESAR